MERVSNEWIISAIGNGLARSSEKIVMALVELQERRADHRTDNKNATDGTQERALRFACEATPAPPNEGCETCIHGALAEDGAKNMGWPSRWQCTLPKERQNDVPMGELHCVPGTIAYFKRKAGIEVDAEC